MPTFEPGLQLCGRFFADIVEPVLDLAAPGVPFAAARIDAGSETLGFDTEMSTDHDWGPQVQVFLDDRDAHWISSLNRALSTRLPAAYSGYPIEWNAAEKDNRTETIENGPTDIRSDNTVENKEKSKKKSKKSTSEDARNETEPRAGNRAVRITTIRGFFQEYLGFDPSAEIAAADWLTFPEQKLRTITCGAVYRDDIGLESVRARFAYYPHDVWLYLMAAGWNRIGQEEHLMGRAGYAGDELGSALIGSRLVRDLMRLCFLFERVYAPYPKWFGTAFTRLPCAPYLSPLLLQAQTARDWKEREAALVPCYEYVARLQNALRVAAPCPDRVMPFFNRPFRVIHLGAGFAEALCRRIVDADVQRIARRRLIGGIDQLSDNTDLTTSAEWRARMRLLYE